MSANTEREQDDDTLALEAAAQPGTVLLGFQLTPTAGSDDEHERWSDCRFAMKAVVHGCSTEAPLTIELDDFRAPQPASTRRSLYRQAGVSSISAFHH